MSINILFATLLEPLKVRHTLTIPLALSRSLYQRATQVQYK